MNDSTKTTSPTEPAMARRVTMAAGTVIFRKGDQRDAAYIIDRGKVQIREDDPESDRVLVELEAGDIFGEMALIDDKARTATAVAAEDTDVYVLSRELLTGRMESLDPLIALMINILIERYRRTRVDLPETAGTARSGDVEKTLRASKKTGKKAPASVATVVERQHVALQELRLEQELRGAVERKEFEPYFQPIIDLRAGRVAGFESLIRWNHPERGMVMPGDFVPVAERTNVVQLLDGLILEKACAAVPLLNEAAGNPKKPLFTSVNLSAINFMTPNIVEQVGEVVRASGVEPRQIRLEITESAFIDDPERAEHILSGFKGLGLGIALDDFGTGYSSLSYLHKLSIDSLKIDRSFITQIHDEDKVYDIVRAIVNLAHDFLLYVVAEGIEYAEDVTALRHVNCDMGQGYFFGKPLSLENAIQYVKDNYEAGI